MVDAPASRSPATQQWRQAPDKDPSPRRLATPPSCSASSWNELRAGRIAAGSAQSCQGVHTRPRDTLAVVAVRVDENGAAYAGSQLQTQLYVNKRTAKLDAAIRTAFASLSGAMFDWRSPLAGDHYDEYWDAAFLKRLELDEHVDAPARFWPRCGPHWDALAVVELPDAVRRGVLLLEAKSYADEMLKGSPLGTDVHPDSRGLIERALAWTQGRLGVPLSVDRWTGPLYQNANRLAHLCFLESSRQRLVRAPTVHRRSARPNDREAVARDRSEG
jgi:hypothetical protein